MKYFKPFALLLAACLMLTGCAQQPASQEGLTVKNRADGTAVVTAYPHLYEGYTYYGTVVDGWAFVYKEGQAGHRAAGGEYQPMEQDVGDPLADCPTDDLWAQMDWLAERYPYAPDEAASESTLPETEWDNTPPQGVETFWANPNGDGCYVLVGDKIRLLDASGNEQPTDALARLTLSTDKKGSILTVTDEDGKQILQLSSEAADPLHTDSDLLLDGDWFYWRTSGGNVVAYQLTVEQKTPAASSSAQS